MGRKIDRLTDGLNVEEEKQIKMTQLSGRLCCVVLVGPKRKANYFLGNVSSAMVNILCS